MKQVPLTRDRIALVDDADFERVVSQGKWYAFVTGRHWYVARSCNPKIYLHRFIMDAPANMDVDHRDGNGLNNQRGNLRVCTRSQNMANQKTQSGRSSRFKGVTLMKDRTHQAHPWRAQIGIDGAYKNLGHFGSEQEAALAYNEAALQAWGEFARPTLL